MEEEPQRAPQHAAASGKKLSRHWRLRPDVLRLRLVLSLRRLLARKTRLLHKLKIRFRTIQKNHPNSKKYNDSSTQTESVVSTLTLPPVTEHESKPPVAGWNVAASDATSTEKSIAEQVAEVAQNALMQTGMVYVESAGMYYDYKSGYYYNSELSLYYHSSTGCYYYYSEDTNEFTYHSHADTRHLAPIQNPDPTLATAKTTIAPETQELLRKKEQRRKHKKDHHEEESNGATGAKRRKHVKKEKKSKDIKDKKSKKRDKKSKSRKHAKVKKNKTAALTSENESDIRDISPDKSIENKANVCCTEKTVHTDEEKEVMSVKSPNCGDLTIVTITGDETEEKHSEDIDMILVVNNDTKIIQVTESKNVNELLNESMCYKLPEQCLGEVTPNIEEKTDKLEDQVSKVENEVLDVKVQEDCKDTDMKPIEDKQRIEMTKDNDEIKYTEKAAKSRKRDRAKAREKVIRHNKKLEKTELDEKKKEEGDVKTEYKNAAVADAIEDGECSETESEADSDTDSSSSDSTITDTEESIVKHHPPALRIVVKETTLAKLKVGSLFLVTKDGGTLGRDGEEHAVLLRDENISRIHLQFIYNEKQRCYQAVDLGSKNGTVLNGSRMSESQQVSEAIEVVHGSTIQVGETKLLCHVHPGTDTCGHCEPGLLMAADDKEKRIAYTRTCDIKKQHALELARLKNRYAPERLAIEEGTYNDRAKVRRETVGSTHAAEKTQQSDLATSIAPDNKGFKMLEKMGWEKDKGLGKEQQGEKEPVPLVGNEGKAGLGAGGTSATAVRPAMKLAARPRPKLKPRASAFRDPLEEDD